MVHLKWGFQCWSFIKSLFLCVFHRLKIYSLTKFKCTLNCTWDQFSLFQKVNGFVFASGRRIELSVIKAQPYQWSSVWPASMSAALTRCLACTLALCMWTTLSATFSYKCGLCPRTLARTFWIPPQHVTLRRARRQLDFTPREGETDRATVSASVPDCV